MRIFTFLLFFLPIAVNGQLWSEDFDGSNTTNPFDFSVCVIDDSRDYYGIVCLDGGPCGSDDINADYTPGYSGVTGSFFGARDINGDPCGTNNPVTSSATGIDISSCSGSSRLYLCFDIAESDTPDREGDDTWDGNQGTATNNSFVTFSASIDGGSDSDIISFAAIANNNSGPAVDLVCDGSGDGAEITGAFTTYCAELHTVGSSLDLSITIGGLNTDGDDVAIDNIEVYCDTPPSGNIVPSCTPFMDPPPPGCVGDFAIFLEDFDGSNTTNPFAFPANCDADASRDYFGIVCMDGVGCPDEINDDYIYSGISGQFFGVRDQDGNTDVINDPTACEGSLDETISATDIDISSCTGAQCLYLCFDAAESQPMFGREMTGGSEDTWDGSSSVNFQVSINGGAFEEITAIESSNGTNTRPGIDTNCGGGSAGTDHLLTTQMQSFCFKLSSQGNTLDLNIQVLELNTDGEDIAIDNIGIYCVEDPICLPSAPIEQCQDIDPVTITCPADNLNLPPGCDVTVPAPDPSLVQVDGCVLSIEHISDVTTSNGCATTVERTYRATELDGVTTVDCIQTFTISTDADPPMLSAMPASTTVECDAIPMIPEITATDNCPTVESVLFINEIHYDNFGTDVGEFLEIAGTAGIDLANYEVYAYEAFDGQFDAQITLSGVIPNEGGTGFGAIAFTRTELPNGFFENGSSDAIALVEIATGEVIKFISYEGTATATNGPAIGMTSTDIGVAEDQNTQVGQSLQLTGLDGCPCTDFTWAGPSAESPGLINAGQTFDINACPSTNEIPVMFTEVSTPGACANEQSITRTWTATDNCGNVAMHIQTITVEDNIAPIFCNPPMSETVSCVIPPAATDVTAIDNCGGGGPIAWINEIHYDNTGTDVGEFIEIAGIAGTDLSGFELLAYDSDDRIDAQMQLSGIIPDESCGYGAVAFFLADLNSQFFENGPEEGRALMETGVGVIDFISYEGSVNAIDGPATGQSSMDIGVFEISSTPVGQSLQLTGMGYSGSTFTWTGPTAESPGTLNTGQTIGTASGIVITFAETGVADPCTGGTLTRTWTASDECGNSDSHVQVVTVTPAPPPTITCPADQVVTCFEDIVVDPADATATAGCGEIVAVYIKQPLITGGIPGCDGTVYTYIYKAIDECGNVAECEQQFLIQNSAPTVTVPADESVGCSGDIMVSVADVTVDADCAGDNVITVFGPEINGPENCPGTTYTYTYRVKDACNRIVEEERVFTINNSTGPIITQIPLDFTSDCGGGPSLQQFTAESICGGGITYEVSDPQVVGTPGCNGSQIRYTYTAMDACGRTATHVQSITIQNNGPEIACPETLQLFGCQDGNTDDLIDAWLASVTAEGACGEALTVSNNFNGNYGMCINNGFTNVTFFTTDQCGRTTSCVGTMIIMDTDAPIIYEDPQEVLVPCNGATQFIFDNWLATQGGAQAIDGCWGDNITWSMNPSNPQLDCDGGPQAIVVEFIATDGCGNSSSVTGIFNTKVQPAFINISGQVHKEDMEAVADVQIGIEGGSAGLPDMDYTENNGAYGLPELEYEENLMIVPHKNNDQLNGLSTYDLILLQQHILSMTILDSPYKRIAADINNSGHISTLDVIHLRRMILFLDEEFQENTSWRFVDADFVFPNPENPFETVFPEVYMLGGLEEELADFVGVKIGDLNLDAVSNLTSNLEDRSDLDDLNFEIADKSLNIGEQHQIDFTVQNFEQINGFQFTINIDQTAIEVLDMRSADLVNFDDKNYNLNKLDKGVITLSWNHNDFVNLRADEVLFSLNVNAINNVQVSEAISITSEYTRAEAYQSNELMNINLSFNANGEVNQVERFRLFQNQPNPFKDATMIGFNLPEAGKVSLEIYDVSGRMIYSEEGEYVEGYNQIDLDRAGLPSGILYYQINTATDSDAKKMILID